MLLLCICVALDELSGNIGDHRPLTYEDLVKNYVVSYHVHSSG